MAVCKEGVEVKGVEQIYLDGFCKGFGKDGGACSRFCLQKFHNKYPKDTMSVRMAMGAIAAAAHSLDSLMEYFELTK